MRPILLMAMAMCAGCTLVNSLDGVIGPPVVDGGASDDAQAGDDDDDADANSAVVDSGKRDTGPAHVDGGPSSDGDVDGAADTSIPDSPAPIYTGVISPLGITVTATDVCWVAGDTVRNVYCAPKGGGTSSDVRALDQSDDTFLVGAFDLAVDDKNVYWSNGSSNQIVKRALNGSGGSNQYFTGDGRISYIILRGTDIFASDYNASSPGPGNIVVGPQSGTTSMLIFPGETGAAGVAVLNDTVYWGTTTALAFGRQTGNVGVTRVKTEAAVSGIAVDAAGIAYLLVGSQKIFRVVVGSTSPELLYDGGSSFGTSDIAVDNDAIYWSEHTHGRIMRMRRPQ